MKKLVVLFLFLSTIFGVGITPSYAAWLSGWGNRLQINVNANNNEALTNYQIKVNIQGHTPAGSLYTDFSLIKPDGADIRFTSSDGTTLLDHWIYSWDDTALTGDMITEIPSITSPNGNFIVYMYYNNSSAGSVSNYTNTMSKKQIDTEDLAILHSDDGSGTVVNDSTTNNNDFTLSNSAAWVSGELVTNPISILSDNKFTTGSHLNFTGTNSDYDLTLSSASIWSGCVLDFGAAYDAQQSTLLDVVPASGYVEFLVQFDYAFPSGYAASFRWFNKNNDETGGSIDLIDIYMNKTDGTLRALKYNNNTLVTLTSTTTSWTAGVWYTVKVSWGTGGYKLFINGSQQASNADTTSWSNGTARDSIFGAYNYGGTISNRADGKMKDMVIYNSTTSSSIASYLSYQYACSGTAINSAASYNMSNSSIMSSGEYANLEVSMWMMPNVTMDNSSTENRYLFSKLSQVRKPLHTNLLYYGVATGKTVLDTFPSKGHIEFSFNPDVIFNSSRTTQYLLQKVNDETGGSEDRIDIYLDGVDGKLTLSVVKNGTTTSIKTATASWPAGVWYLCRFNFGEDGLYIGVDHIHTKAENTYESIPSSGTARDLIFGAANMGGTVSNIFDGKLSGLTIYDDSNNTILADYTLSDGSGTTLTDSSGNVQHIILSSASIWDASEAISDGIYGTWTPSDGRLWFGFYKRFKNVYVGSTRTTWTANTWYHLRFCLGWEGIFLYVNNSLTDGKADYSIRNSFRGGADNPFSFGSRQYGGANYHTNIRMDEINIASTHYSPMRATAFYEFRKTVTDPFIYYGTVISNSNITWGSDKRDFYEPNVFWDGTKYQMVFDCTPRSLTRLDTCLATSTDGRTWTDYASNPIIQGYIRPYIFSDEMGVPIKMGSPPKYWVYVVDDGVPTPTPGGGTVFHRFSCTDFDAGCTDDGQVLTIGTSGQWDDKYLGNNTTWKEGTNYYMMYDGMGVSVANWWEGYATSSDGMSWTKYGSNPVIKGWAADGTAGSLSIHKINGIYYAYDLEAPTSTTVPTDITYLTSTDRINWTHVLSKTPVLQRSSWRNNDQYGDPNLVQGTTETLLYVDEIPYNIDVISTVALFYAPNKTIEQVMMPDPTLSGSSESLNIPINILNIWWDRQRKREYTEGGK